MRQFTKFEIAVIKRTAQNVAPVVAKKNRIKAKINALTEEYNSLCRQQEQFEASVRTMTGGYGTEDIVERQTVRKTNDDGTVTMVTKYVLIYPDTVIPPAEDTGGIDMTEEPQGMTAGPEWRQEDGESYEPVQMI